MNAHTPSGFYSLPIVNNIEPVYCRESNLAIIDSSASGRIHIVCCATKIAQCGVRKKAVSLDDYEEDEYAENK